MVVLSSQRRMMTVDGLNSVSMLHAGRLGAAGDWWDPAGDGLCVWSAYQPKGAASLAASYTDLSGNGNDAFLGVAPTWDNVNGWKFDGITQYLRTGYTHPGNQDQSVILQWTNMADEPYYCICGHTSKFGLRMRNGLTDLYGWNGGSTVVVAGLPNYSAANGCVAGRQFYLDGVARGPLIAVNTVATGFCYIGDAQGSVAWGPKAYYCQAFALYDCTLTAPQVAAIAAAMAAL